ncbi:5-deoxy-glucuronate isomerase [Aequitasia blattaphilus]|uniref:5-deoxy-glucuronate isomerase n=1 Tax=Aequitasia blattaphilus TaxID=2949332 RepID=A0ABT1EDZ1_9FIRM|nr:5-deoxy-glucuronate isomerase [Aequitasia blattaphilus]MCP1103157.1 5-deoxy-glucuronate isomerase [Aequitasia blattaphilus]MCR8615797.1 5-deoxy-glucuronate isomerase [Aequitasia blattaphilus]
MKKVFGYPSYDEKGEMILSTYTNEYQDMLMDVRVYKMKKGEIRTFEKKGEETAVLLLSGKIVYHFNGTEEEASRTNVFDEGPYCVHAATGSVVAVEAEEESEILVQSTKNEKEFETKFYVPEDAPFVYSSVGKFGNVAKRRVNTIFDLDIAPYSNMVLGEVLNDRGNWSGYLPHRHPQPELYYFLFDKPEGFGASFVGDQVFKSVNQSFSAIPGGELHPQAVAPGYQMYTCWMIRHLEGNPWHQTDRNEDERYMWLHDADFTE